jgi:hypothetical protein
MFDLASTGLGCGSTEGNDGERSSGIFIRAVIYSLLTNSRIFTVYTSYTVHLDLQ